MTDELKQWDPLLFTQQVIIPGLEAIQHYDEAGATLVLGTGMVESGLKYVRQIGGGPALGYFQEEPLTHNDSWCRWLGPTSREYIMAGLRMLTPNAGMPEALVSCPQYAAAMCRIKYLSISKPMPDAEDAAALAHYHKVYYNSALGKADEEQNVCKFQQAINVIKMLGKKNG